MNIGLKLGFNVFGSIKVTDHAIKRYQKRIKDQSTQKARKSIKKMVSDSQLVNLDESEPREIREKDGIILILEKDYKKTQVKNRAITTGVYIWVITLMFSRTKLNSLEKS